MRRWLGAVLLLGGCTVGEGTGDATGSIFVLSCKNGDDLGTEETPVPYRLDPRFFAGEPINDVSLASIKQNRLIIRMQTTGRRREVNDVLRFDVTNSYEVARCVRGRVVNGKPDYQTNECAWDAEGPRMRVGSDAIIRANLTLGVTCPERPIAATAVSKTRMPPDAQAWESWIELLDFGAAKVDAAVPPEQRETTDRGFRVDFNQRLRAKAFALTLEDDRRVSARKRGDPIPGPEIGGQLGGFFDFDLERGQGAQTFP